jgi:hypothetical protein
MLSSASVTISQFGPKKEKQMRMRFLTIAVALASMFAAQQAVAKSSSKTAAASKKHHKKHMKKTASTAAPAGKAALAIS